MHTLIVMISLTRGRHRDVSKAQDRELTGNDVRVDIAYIVGPAISSPFIPTRPRRVLLASSRAHKLCRLLRW